MKGRRDAGTRPDAAVLVFVRAPERGRVKTRLAAQVGNDEALRIYRALAEHAVARALALGAAAEVRIHYTPSIAGHAVARWLGPGPIYLPQVGGDLGARLEAAFADAFAAGHGRVLVIGSDLPTLRTAHLRRALKLLQTHAAVLGPARDGGYWLLGLRAPLPHIFRDIEWSTPAVLAQTRARLAAAGITPALLPTLTDVDTAADLPPPWRPGSAPQR